MIDFKKQKRIYFYFNNKRVYGYEGDSVAAALHAFNIRELSTSLRYKRPRGFFCGIGKCSSCLMRVNGVPNVRTCIYPLSEGLRVETQDAEVDLPDDVKFNEEPFERVSVDVLVVGGGPAGLSAALEAAKQNAAVLLADENPQIGGQLIKQTHKFFGSKQEDAGTRGIHIAEKLTEEVKKLSRGGGILLMPGSTVIGNYEPLGEELRFALVKKTGFRSKLYEVKSKTVIFAVGAMENMLLFPGNDLPGVYGAGAVQTLMNVFGVKPGDRALMVGAGNVGLIVAYQLLQAGTEVERVVEAAPVIGGYHVHAAKLRRCGVPITTSCSIKRVYGDRRVEGAEIVKLDEKWRMIKGTEEKVECDLVCLAVGLTPSVRLLGQMGVELVDVPEAGGLVAIHDENLETTVENVFVAGDCSGIEEASTAMLEGKIAGLSAVEKIGLVKKPVLKERYREELDRLRAGPFGEKARLTKNKIKRLWREKKRG